MTAAKVLEAAGYETIIFHAVGTGGRAMEEMMRQGLIGAVLDYSTIEVSNEMYHALLAGGPDRLTTAGKLGLPQVICPGAIEVLVFNEPETVPAQYNGRRLVRHSPQITDLRLNRDEMAEVGREIGKRLQATTRRRRLPDPDRRLRQLRHDGRGVLRSARPTPPSSPTLRESAPRERPHRRARPRHQRSGLRHRGRERR